MTAAADAGETLPAPAIPGEEPVVLPGLDDEIPDIESISLPWLAPVREPEDDEEAASDFLPWIDLPTEPLPPLLPNTPPPDLPLATPPPAPATAPPPVPAAAMIRPVAVIAPVSYVEDARQRLRYALRLVATLALLTVGALVLVWAFGELLEATDAALDLFTDTTEVTLSPGP